MDRATITSTQFHHFSRQMDNTLKKCQRLASLLLNATSDQAHLQVVSKCSHIHMIMSWHGVEYHRQICFPSVTTLNSTFSTQINTVLLLVFTIEASHYISVVQWVHHKVCASAALVRFSQRVIVFFMLIAKRLANHFKSDVVCKDVFHESLSGNVDLTQKR